MQTFHDLTIHRRSYRKYTSELLSPDQVRLILEAALMSPAGKRLNPWHFIVVEDREMLQKLSKVKDMGAAPIADAALAIVVCADTTVSDTWVEDCSIASHQIQLQCADLGLGAVWIQMRNRNDADGNTATYNISRLLELPPSVEVLSVMSIGHPAEERKPYDTEKLMWEKVHIGKF